ncbi:MAG: ParA family protein [Chloroflexi bacterium]|nr:ParA family protein [Chloroflexota bacterium]
MAHIYTLVNQKGGVGKTTTAINLSAYLAQLGQRVLLVDLDAQANATSCLGIDKRKVDASIYDVLMDDVKPADVILFNAKLKIALLPSTPALSGAEVELVSEIGRETRLKQTLASLKKEYDYILIDCPPSLSLLTVNGLVAAEAVIIPVQCEYLALEGLGQLAQTISRVRSSLNTSLTIRGLVMTMFDARTGLSMQVVEEVRKHFPGKVFKNIIPRSVRLAEAPSHGVPISAFAASSAGAQAYHALAEELLKGDQK